MRKILLNISRKRVALVFEKEVTGLRKIPQNVLKKIRLKENSGFSTLDLRKM